MSRAPGVSHSAPLTKGRGRVGQLEECVFAAHARNKRPGDGGGLTAHRALPNLDRGRTVGARWGYPLGRSTPRHRTARGFSGLGCSKVRDGSVQDAYPAAVCTVPKGRGAGQQSTARLLAYTLSVCRRSSGSSFVGGSRSGSLTWCTRRDCRPVGPRSSFGRVELLFYLIVDHRKYYIAKP